MRTNIRFWFPQYIAVLFFLLIIASCGVRDNPDSVSGVEEGRFGQLQEENEKSGLPEANSDEWTAVADFHYMEMDSAIETWRDTQSYAINSEWLYVTDRVENREGNEGGSGDYFGITRKRIADGCQEKNYVVTDIEDGGGRNRPLLLADREGNCYIFWRLRSWEDSAMNYAYILEKYGTEGNLLWRTNLAPDELLGMGEMLDQGTVTGDGRVFLYSYGAEGHVFGFGTDGELEEIYIPGLESLEGVAVGEDNQAYGYCVTGENPVFVELGGKGKSYNCPVVPLAVYDGHEGGICLRTGEGLIRYQPETGETEEIWKWEDEYVQVNGDKVDRFFHNDGIYTLLCFEMMSSDHARQILTVASVVLENSGEYPGRQTLTLATDALNSDTMLFVQMYNRQSKEYRVEVTETADGETLQKQLLRGEGADLMEVGRIYTGDLERQGVFEDLAPYYESSTVVGQEDILQSVRKACAAGGKNATVIPGFCVRTMRARGDFVTADEWTVWKFLELGQDNRMFSSQDPLYALNCCMGMKYGEHFIDDEKKACSFDGEEFRRILESCSRWERFVYRNEDGRQVDGSEEKGDWLMDYQRIESAWDLVQQEVLGESAYYEYEGEDYSATLVGYPGWEGGEYMLQASQIFAINSASENKEGAWDFLEYLLSEEIQSRMGQISRAMPARRDCFEASLENLYYDPAYVKPKLPSKEDILHMQKMVESAVLKDFGIAFHPVWKIVSEEAEMYFAGDATLDATVQKIQTRVQLYLNEL